MNTTKSKAKDYVVLIDCAACGTFKTLQEAERFALRERDPQDVAEIVCGSKGSEYEHVKYI